MTTSNEHNNAPAVQGEPVDGLRSIDGFYGDDHIQDIAHALAQECEEAELNPNDYATVNREKLVAIAKRVLTKAAAMLAATPAPAPAQDEPFGYFRAEPFGWTDCAKDDEGAIALYERPQEVGLTDEEIEAIAKKHMSTVGDYWCNEDAIRERHAEDFARAIIAALRAKGQS